MSQEKLEARLREHRGTKDRSNLLENTLQTHRLSRPNQEQRKQRLDATHMEGRNEVYWDFATKNLGAACRYDDLGLIDLLEQRRTQPAVALGTGIVSLDYALGGIPSGVTEIYGTESVGKTSLIIDMMLSAQGLMGMDVAICPSEFFDEPYFRRQGIDLDSLLVFRGEYGEDVLELAGDFVISGGNRALFLDSATGLRPKKDEFDNWLKMMLSWLEQVVPRMGQFSCIIMTNQVRVKRSVDPTRIFAGGTDSTARRIAGIFDQRLELTREEVSEDKFTLVVNVVANTLRPPARFVRLPFIKGKGVDSWRDLVRSATTLGVLQQHGSWYSYEETTIAQGEEAVAQLLETNTDFGYIVLEDTLRVLRSEGTS